MNAGLFVFSLIYNMLNVLHYLFPTSFVMRTVLIYGNIRWAFFKQVPN